MVVFVRRQLRRALWINGQLLDRRWRKIPKWRGAAERDLAFILSESVVEIEGASVSNKGQFESTASVLASRPERGVGIHVVNEVERVVCSACLCG